MKFSTTTAMALGMAPLALGKAVNNVYPPVRRGEEVVAASEVSASQAQIAELERLIGLSQGSSVEINFLWVNLGGGAATTVLGSAKTVTVTQTVAGAAATVAAPPAVTNAAGEAATTAAATPPTGTSAAAAGGKTHPVTVGGPQGLAYDPPQLAVNVGDTVVFTFLSQNHTVTQSSFGTPCQALAGGMDSGFQANPNNTVNPAPQVAMQVMVDTPLWFYCRQKGHCGKGMTFSINPTANKTQAAFQAAAIAQNGTGTGSAITGNSGASSGASSAAAGSATSLAPLPGASTDAAATATSASGAAATGVVTGSGQVQADGSCVCAVQCAFPGFPNAQVQGRDSFGGFGGSVPAAMVNPLRVR